MSLNLTNSVTLTSSTVKDGCTDELNNQVLLVEATGPSLRIYNLATFSQVGSNYTCVGGPAAVCLINALSAVVVSSSFNTVDFIQISSGFRSNVAGGNTINTNVAGNCKIASDQSLGIAFAICSTPKILVKIVAATQTVSQLQLDISSPNTANPYILSVILKPGGGRWLIGTYNAIYEIDSTGKIFDSMAVTSFEPSGTHDTTLSATDDGNPVYSMCMDGNILLVNHGQFLSTYDYSTKTLISRLRPIEGTNSNSLSLCPAFSGETIIVHGNFSQPGIIQEVDFTTRNNPHLVPGGLSQIFTDTSITYANVGINTISSRGWALQTSTDKIRFFTVTPRSFVSKTIQVNPGGIDQKARVMLFDDTASPATLMFDTVMQSPGTYKLTPGKSVIELIKIGEGSNASYDVSRYST